MSTWFRRCELGSDPAVTNSADYWILFLMSSLAYWGSMNNNFTVVQEAYRQIKAYREILRDPSTGYWMHVSSNGQWDGMSGPLAM